MWWWRKVRNHIHWRPGEPTHPDGPGYYTPDFTLRREKGETGLSLFGVPEPAEAARVTRYYGLTRMSLGNVDYLLIPDGPFALLGLIPAPAPYENLHPVLSACHFEVIGLTPELETRLAAAVLAEPGCQALRMKKSVLQADAPGLLKRDPSLRAFLHEDWEEWFSSRD